MKTQHEVKALLIAEFPALLSECACGIWIDEGWLPLVRELFSKIAASDPSARLSHVKEKVGALRISFHEGSDSTGELIHEAERASVKICDVCGDPGSIQDFDGRYAARCPKHPVPDRGYRKGREEAARRRNAKLIAPEPINEAQAVHVLTILNEWGKRGWTYQTIQSSYLSGRQDMTHGVNFVYHTRSKVQAEIAHGDSPFDALCQATTIMQILLEEHKPE